MLPLLSLALLLLAPGIRGSVVIDTQYGPVEGHTTFAVNNGKVTADIDVFLAIPYANSTAGNNRFRNAVPPPAWTDPLPVNTLGQACPQNPASIMIFTHPNWTNYGEDCLQMNIFTPTDRAGELLPVMVWIHGGAYVANANLPYTGQFLAAYGLVIVVPNYRLGNFGFAFTADDAAPGNNGMWDQLMALRFVRDNIANFGGDPNRVTVFGQSAGGASTGLHMVSPQSQGLFHQAIMESGTESNLWSVNWPESHPEDYTRQVAEKLDCPTDDTFAMMDCLRGVPMDDLVNTNFTCTPGWLCSGMGPVVDNPSGFLPMKPQDLRAAGNIMKGPTILGITSEDASLYTVAYIPASLLGGFGEDQFQFYIKNRALSFWNPLFDNTTSENMFQAINWQYAPWPYLDDRDANRLNFSQLMTDAAFGMSADAVAKNQSEVADVYQYVFGYRGRNTSNFIPEWMGVPHIGEIPYVWGWPQLRNNPGVQNDSQIFEDFIDWTDEDREYTAYWQELYANFAKTGNPTPTPVQNPNGLGETTWSPLTWDALNVLYVTNTSIDVIQEYRQKSYAFWGQYINYIGGDAPLPMNPAAYSADAWFPEGLPSNYISDKLAQLYRFFMSDLDLGEITA